jgi:hypothetical protein
MFPGRPLTSNQVDDKGHHTKEVSMKLITKGSALLIGALFLASTGTANAQPRRGGRMIIGGGYYHSPFFYDPFWGPYGYGGYGFYPYDGRAESDVRTEVTPKQAEVYVDGYYAGVADDFDGAFKHLHTTPGGHVITLYLEGFRTVTQNIYVAPDTTFKLHDTMEKLSAGQASEQPPLPARPLGSAPRRSAVRPSPEG